MDTESKSGNVKIGLKDGPRKRSAVRRKPKEYSGSRWAGLILLIITFIVSLFFYARGGFGNFLSSLFGPARYSIQK